MCVVLCSDCGGVHSHNAAQYFKVASPSKVQEMVALLKNSLAALHHSNDGARIAAACLASGSTKDRKALVKAIKGISRVVFGVR